MSEANKKVLRFCPNFNSSAKKIIFPKEKDTAFAVPFILVDTKGFEPSTSTMRM